MQLFIFCKSHFKTVVYTYQYFLLIEPPDINEGSGLTISPMVPVPVGQNLCIRSGSSAILSCMLVRDDITLNPKTFTWSPIGSSTPAITVNTAGTYMCTVSNDCGNDTAQSTVSSKS